MTTEKHRRAFLSYSRINKEFATKLAKGLRSAGYPIWFDLMDIPTGSRWDDEVENALRDCSIFMIILTPASIASENVKDEIGYAIDHGKRILPVLLEDCDVPLRLRRFQYVDFTSKSFEEGFESAKDLLGDLIDEVSIPVGATAPTVDVPVEVKPAPVQAKPVAAVESKPAVVEKAPSNKKGILTGIAIGVVAVIVLCIVVVSLSNSAAKKTASQAASAMLLSTTEAGNLMSIGAIPEYLDDVALRVYSESELKKFSDAGQPIPLTIDSQSPLLLGYFDCATTRAILDGNMASYINEVYSIGGYVIPESSIGHYYTETDGKSCVISDCSKDGKAVVKWAVGQSANRPTAKRNKGTRIICA